MLCIHVMRSGKGNSVWERTVRVHGRHKTESILIHKLDLDTQRGEDYRELLERMRRMKMEIDSV